jgi:hypothetical protein
MFRISRRAGHLLIALAMLPITILGINAVGATPALAESSTTLTAQYPWPHNGCTIVSDNAPGASFTYACNHHDGCYAGHWANRATCDQWFLNDMSAACRTAPFEMITGCMATAYVYYGGVRAMGQSHYDSNGAQVRISTPMRIG